jgi:putative transposase
MKQYYPTVGLGTLCGLFGKSRQAFYDHDQRSGDEQFHEALVMARVRQLRESLPGIGGLKLYGILKQDTLLQQALPGRDGFYALLSEHGLLIKRRKRYVRTTDSNHPYRKWPDLVKGMEVKATGQLWVSDITYLSTTKGFVYLSLITDACSRKIVGYHLSRYLRAQGCIIALNKAIGQLKGSKETGTLIHHSDRGIQYCCEPYVTILQQNNICISMTQSGSPYDNALAERVNGILKHEAGLGKTFKDYAEALAAVSTAIDAYNRLRPHMGVGNLTPEQAHKTGQPPPKTWKKRKYKQKTYDKKEQTV